jgi:uncharacterized protein (DUF433 family)
VREKSGFGDGTVKFRRITTDPVPDGRSCIRGLRIPVVAIVAMIGDGMNEAE